MIARSSEADVFKQIKIHSPPFIVFIPRMIFVFCERLLEVRGAVLIDSGVLIHKKSEYESHSICKTTVQKPGFPLLFCK